MITLSATERRRPAAAAVKLSVTAPEDPACVRSSSPSSTPVASAKVFSRMVSILLLAQAGATFADKLVSALFGLLLLLLLLLLPLMSLVALPTVAAFVKLRLLPPLLVPPPSAAKDVWRSASPLGSLASGLGVSPTSVLCFLCAAAATALSRACAMKLDFRAFASRCDVSRQPPGLLLGLLYGIVAALTLLSRALTATLAWGEPSLVA